jgi:hypothetical protein
MFNENYQMDMLKSIERFAMLTWGRDLANNCATNMEMPVGDFEELQAQEIEIYRTSHQSLVIRLGPYLSRSFSRPNLI